MTARSIGCMYCPSKLNGIDFNRMWPLPDHLVPNLPLSAETGGSYFVGPVPSQIGIQSFSQLHEIKVVARIKTDRLISDAQESRLFVCSVGRATHVKDCNFAYHDVEGRGHISL